MDASGCAVGGERVESLENTDHLTENHLRCREDFGNQEGCDVTLASADGEFQVMAHRGVLASTSKYFHAMFDGSLRESKEREIKLSQFDGRTLKAILDFIYKGKAEVTPDTVESVLVGAHVLELSALEELCCTYMKGIIDASNCLGISQFAKLYNFDKLINTAVLCACENFVGLREEEEFLLLSFEEICELISKDDLRMPCEADVLRGILAWIGHEKNVREHYFEQLLSFVRFPLLSREFVYRFIEEEVKCADMQQMIRMVQERTVDRDAIWFSYNECKVRNFNDVIIVIRGLGDADKDISVAFYYFGSNEWIYTKWPSSPYPARREVKCTILGRKIVVAGGRERIYNSQRVEYLNLDTLEWGEWPCVGRTYSLFALNGALYSTGDHRFWKLTEPFERWTKVKIPQKIPEWGPISLCAPYKNSFYFLYGHYYCSYNSLDGSFNMQNIPVRHTLSKPSFPSMHIARHMGVDCLVDHIEYVTNTFEEYTHVYDLSTCECVREVESGFGRFQLSHCFGHGEYIISYDANKQFHVYDLCGYRLHTLPIPIDDEREIDIVLGGSNI